MSPRIAAWAGLSMLPVVVFALMGVWTGDDRWAATAGVLLVALVLATAATIILSEEWHE